MSLKPSRIDPVPELTAQIAHAAFPKGNPYLKLRDELGSIYDDEDFADLFPPCGQPGLAPWRLALVTVLQFRENLADRQAAEAVRARIDWKYLLGLELNDPGFDFSVLCEFRGRLLGGEQEALLLERLLERCRERGLLKARGRQRTDATHVLAAIRVLNRLELVAETLRAALNELAAIAPEWLRGVAPPAWYERYAKRIEDSRLPKDGAGRDAYAQTVVVSRIFSPCVIQSISEQIQRAFPHWLHRWDSVGRWSNQGKESRVGNCEGGVWGGGVRKGAKARQRREVARRLGVRTEVRRRDRTGRAVLSPVRWDWV